LHAGTPADQSAGTDVHLFWDAPSGTRATYSVRVAGTILAGELPNQEALEKRVSTHTFRSAVTDKVLVNLRVFNGSAVIGGYKGIVRVSRAARWTSAVFRR